MCFVTLQASVSHLTYARIDSVTVPIWLTFSSRQLQAFSSTALLMRLGLVTVRSSPTTWMSVLPVKSDQAAQSSWSKGSSIETTRSKECVRCSDNRQINWSESPYNCGSKTGYTSSKRIQWEKWRVIFSLKITKRVTWRCGENKT